MDPFSGLVLGVVLTGVFFLVLYSTVRAAVRAGIRDARLEERDGTPRVDAS